MLGEGRGNFYPLQTGGGQGPETTQKPAGPPRLPKVQLAVPAQPAGGGTASAFGWTSRKTPELQGGRDEGKTNEEGSKGITLDASIK